MTPVEKQIAPPGGWQAYGTPRIEPFDTRRLSLPMRLAHRIAGRFAKRRVGMPRVPDVFLVLMRNRRLFQPWLRFAGRLIVVIGQKEGLAPADELHRDRVISAGTWQRLAGHYDASQLIEVGMLVGHYEMLAGVLNSVGLALEPDIAERLARTPIHG